MINNKGEEEAQDALFREILKGPSFQNSFLYESRHFAIL
jgi:hypothetical protein